MAGNNCSLLCCDTFMQGEQTAERVPNMKIRPIDRCNNKAVYFGTLGEDFKVFMPVTAATDAGTVSPADIAADDILGVALCTKTATADDNKIIVARTGVICWSDLAVSLGEDSTDQAAWWSYHVALAKYNIYVEFN